MLRPDDVQSRFCNCAGLGLSGLGCLNGFPEPEPLTELSVTAEVHAEATARADTLPRKGNSDKQRRDPLADGQGAAG